MMSTDATGRDGVAGVGAAPGGGRPPEDPGASEAIPGDDALLDSIDAEGLMVEDVEGNADAR